MDIKVHNKLVRDNIPEILSKRGIEVKVEVIESDKAVVRPLLHKLIEEAREAAVADDGHFLEELADIETVIDALLAVKNLTRQELKLKQELKDKERGRYAKRFFLISTKEEK